MELIDRVSLMAEHETYCGSYNCDLYYVPSEAIASFPTAFKGKTNGDVIISLYPNLKYTIRNGRVVTTIGVASSFDLEWWNSPYIGGKE